MTITVVVADDQVMIRRGLTMILDAAPGVSVVGEAGTGVEAVARAAELRPDVVLMDIRMPQLDGIEATRRIVAGHGARTRVAVLTTFGTEEYVFAALRAGASAFLLKNAPPEQLVEAVRVVHAGESLLAPSVTRGVIERSLRAGDAQRPLVALPELTGRELEVLRLMACGMSNNEIAVELVVSRTTVKTHVSHVLDKLGVRDRVQAVVAAYEAGVVAPTQ
jgi:DNA-binding NarL/FixJ family response regulator